MNTEERIELAKSYVEFLNMRGFRLKLETYDYLEVTTYDGEPVEYYFGGWVLLLWRGTYYELMKSSDDIEDIIEFLHNKIGLEAEFEEYLTQQREKYQAEMDYLNALYRYQKLGGTL